MSTDEKEKKAYDRWSLRDEETIDYGYGAKTGGKDDNSDHTFYITTAINYTNGPAHMGHAYEAATTDALARFARLKGTNATYFVTGTDEHGQKIATTAVDQGMEPIELCNKYVTGFQCLNQRILISNDDYIRTTSDRHKRTAKELWKRVAAQGDIYLHHYRGWYNVREETFVTDSEAQLSDYKDPTSGVPLKQVEEESYFFKMSEYHDRLVEYIETHEDFIRPQNHRNHILSRLATDRLRDLSISRTSFEWGIPVPEGFDANHVMYVWVDALSNYLTGVDHFGLEEGMDLKRFWPANVHIIGKDILWFHTVIWPCLLMSAGVPLPKTVFAHGFVNDREGKKMSKSLGNVVDPHDMLDKYPVDIFRWYLCKEAPYGGELSFNEDSLRDMHNSDLCDTLGNLVHRATNLCQKYCNGLVPDVSAPPEWPVHLDNVLDVYTTKMDNFELEAGASTAIHAFRDVNGYLTKEAPWLLKGDENAEARRIVVRATLEAIYALTHLLLPFCPTGASEIFRKLHTAPISLAQLRTTGQRNLVVGTPIEVGHVLYTKLVSEEERLNAEQAAKNKATAYAEAQQKKKERKAKAIAASQKGSGGKDDQPDFTKMDIRVGKITKVWNHPDADKLFCEEINVGEKEEVRPVASGLRGHYELDDLQDKLVLVVCNLKASKIVGSSSNGMVLAAKKEDTVELVTPPDGSVVGERVFCQGITAGEPLSSTQVKKRKVWDAVSKQLQTNEEGVAMWDGNVIQTSAGPCTCGLAGAPIS